MSLFQQQRVHIKISILDTSIKIFKEKGYENTTIDEITKNVGIAKGTFYNFYNSKSEVLIAWAAQKFQEVNIHQAFDRCESLEENLFRFIRILVDAIGDEEQLFQSFLKEILKVHNDKKYNEQFDFMNIYHQIIRNSRDADKVLKYLLDIKIEVLNSSLFMGMIKWFDEGNSNEGLEQHLTNIVQVCLHGVLSNMKEGL